ncbi:PAS domain S-box protein [Desulfonatronovibrio hydrogenovorans]|uniref:PAS domain S-box protein n=2 Tax=Desulfonatronovibrio hydrogenovorans TaxID=53245 RepID=UPI00068BCF44
MSEHKTGQNGPEQMKMSVDLDYRDILENSPVGIFISTPGGRYLSANPALARMYGYSSPEELVETVSDIAGQVYVNPSDRDEYKSLLEKHGKVINFVSQRLRKDGTVFWVSLNSRAVRNGLGNITHYHGFTTDITEQKLAQIELEREMAEKLRHLEAFKKEEEQRKILMNNSRDGIVIIDQEHRVIEANESFSRMLGYSSEEICTLHTWDWEAVLTREQIQSGFDNLSKARSLFETRHKRKDGSVFDVEVSASGARVSGQNIVFAVCRDITKRKKVEHDLKKSESYYRAVFETTGSAQVIINKDTIISRANSKFEALSGYLCHEVEGKMSWTEFVHPDDLERMTEFHHDRRKNEAGAPKVYEFRFIDRSGQEHFIYLSVAMIPGTDQSIASLMDISQLKRTEFDLRESESRNKALLSALPDMIFLLDKEGVFLDYHAPGENMLLRDPGFFIGKRVHEVLAPDIGEMTLETIRSICQAGEAPPYQYELSISGSPRYFESRMVACGDHFLAIVRDVTQQTNDQAELKEKTQLLQKITDNMFDLVCLVDLQGKYKYVSPSYRIFGYDLDELVGKKMMDHIHPDDLDSLIKTFEGAKVSREKVWTAELRYKSARGDYLWIETVARLILGENGSPQEIIFCSRDITGRKKIENELTRSNEELKTAERMAGMGSWKYDPVWDMVTGSDEAYRIIGLKNYKGVPFSRLLEVIHEDDRSRITDLRDLILDTPQSFDFDLRVVVLGKQKWLRIAGALRSSRQGGNPVAMGMVMDITEKKELEIKEKRQNEQLAQASKMTALGTLVAGVAHEINNPTNLIMLNAPILEKIWDDALPIIEAHHQLYPDFEPAGIPWAQLEEIGAELFSGINEGSKRISKIVSELKNFARQSPLSLTDLVSINEIVESALTLISKTILRYTNNFRVTLEPDIPVIRGDFHKLEQVVVNLLINSCQALTDKNEAISLKTFYWPDQATIGIKIIDQGEGIHPDNLSRILDPFFSTRRQGGGTGLGLSISSSIIKNHNGTIGFESEPGKGTTATVLLKISRL